MVGVLGVLAKIDGSPEKSKLDYVLHYVLVFYTLLINELTLQQNGESSVNKK